MVLYRKWSAHFIYDSVKIQIGIQGQEGCTLESANSDLAVWLHILSRTLIRLAKMHPKGHRDFQWFLCEKFAFSWKKVNFFLPAGLCRDININSDILLDSSCSAISNTVFWSSIIPSCYQYIPYKFEKKIALLEILWLWAEENCLSFPRNVRLISCIYSVCHCCCITLSYLNKHEA